MVKSESDCAASCLVGHAAAGFAPCVPAVKLTVHDQIGARRTGSVALDLSESSTVREIIRSRVYQEVQDFNQQQPEYFRGLVTPSDAEQTLNGLKVHKGRTLDWEEQFKQAVEGFETNRFFILIGDRQASHLDEVFHLTPETDVSFVKLVPMVGG